MEIKILSSQNTHYKEWKKLHLKKYRNISNLFMIEGVKAINEAIIWGSIFNTILYSDKLFNVNGGRELYKNVEQKDILLYELEHSLLKDLSDTENSQGIIGIVEQPKYDINYLLNSKESSIIILEEIQDPGNLGTIIRTADAAGFDGIILSKGCVDVYNEKVIRSTMGSIFHLPIFHDIKLNEIIPKLIDRDYQIVGTDLNTKCFYHELNYSKKKALIIGNEANGITKSTADLCNNLVKIPIKGNAESLNAAIAAGILMYKMQGI